MLPKDWHTGDVRHSIPYRSQLTLLLRCASTYPNGFHSTFFLSSCPASDAWPGGYFSQPDLPGQSNCKYKPHTNKMLSKSVKSFPSFGLGNIFDHSCSRIKSRQHRMRKLNLRSRWNDPVYNQIIIMADPLIKICRQLKYDRFARKS